MDRDFELYCETLTNSQLEYVLKKEYDAKRELCYLAAKVEAARRGWTVTRGKRID